MFVSFEREVGRGLGAQRDALSYRKHLGSTRAFVDEVVQIEFFDAQLFLPGVCPNQRQHIVDDQREPLRFVVDYRQRLSILGGPALGRKRYFGFTPDDRATSMTTFATLAPNPARFNDSSQHFTPDAARSSLAGH
jgi:hypothetical protein